MKNLSKCQELMTVQQEIYQIICIIKNITNPLAQIYQDQTNTSTLQQIKFTGKLEEDDSAAMLFIDEKNYCKFFFRFFNCNKII